MPPGRDLVFIDQVRAIQSNSLDRSKLLPFAIQPP